MSPADDSFLTASRDRTVRLWDLKSAGAIVKLTLDDAKCNPASPPKVVLDSTGMVFCVTAEMANGAGNVSILLLCVCVVFVVMRDDVLQCWVLT